MIHHCASSDNSRSSQTEQLYHTVSVFLSLSFYGPLSAPLTELFYPQLSDKTSIIPSLPPLTITFGNLFYGYSLLQVLLSVRLWFQKTGRESNSYVSRVLPGKIGNHRSCCTINYDLLYRYIDIYRYIDGSIDINLARGRKGGRERL